MLQQHNMLETRNPLSTGDASDDYITAKTAQDQQDRTSASIAKEKWGKQPVTPPKTEKKARVAQRPAAPVLDNIQESEHQALQKCIQQGIERMQKMLAEQERLAMHSENAERVKDLMSPAMRSVIRGRERMLSLLSGDSALYK